MILDIVRDESGFHALEPFWDSLLEQSSTRSIFMRWDWVRLWWEEFHEDFDLTIAVVRDSSGTPVAIAPLMIGAEHEGMRKHLRHIGFLAGLGEAKGERMDFLVPKGKEALLTPLLCEAFQELASEWQAVRLNKLPAESPNYPIIAKVLGDALVGAGVMIQTPCFCIHLPTTVAEFDDQPPIKRKRELRRKASRMAKEHHVTEQVVSSTDAEARMDEFARLHALHFPEGVSSFLTPRVWRFHRRLALKWLASGRALLPYITVNGNMAGAIYGFIEGEEFLFFQLGWDPQFAPFSMGHLSIRWAVECCIDRHLRLYDMLPGTYRYKSDWSQSARQVLDFEAYQPESLRAALFRSVRHLKRLLPPTSSASLF